MTDRRAFTLIELSKTVRQGFTLIELLVVITIIVVLLALLTPALEKAIYQAELATCGARLKGIATGVTIYTVDNKRHYPYRQFTDTGWQPALVKRGTNSRFFMDYLRRAFPDDGLLHCPLAGETDLYKSTATETFSSYNLWFSWQYAPGGASLKGMLRVGDRFEWDEQSPGGTTRSYNLLASDRDNILAPAGAFNEAQSSHPDVGAGVMANVVVQDGADPFWYTLGVPEGASPETITIALWRSPNTPERGPVDDNFAYDDNSVSRVDGVAWNSDDRMGKVGVFRGDNNTITTWLYVPRN